MNASRRFPRLVAVVLPALLLLAVSPMARAMTPDLSDRLSETMRAPFKGDFDAILERGFLRVLVPFSRTFYFIDGGTQRGTTVDMMGEFGKFLVKRHGKAARDGHIVFLPTPRERLFSDLAAGRGDIAMGNLTVTDDRKALTAFSDPLYTGISEVPVSGTDMPALETAEALSGRTVHVRRSSSYFSSLSALNERLAKAGRPLVEIVEVDDALEDEDLAEIVAAGGIDLIVMDSHKAAFWAGVLDGLRVHDKAPLREGGEIAIALRKDAPKLAAELNAFVKTARQGTLIGNMILKRYLKDTTYLEKLDDPEHVRRYEAVRELFARHGGSYDIDWLLVSAQSFQESRWDQSVRSRAGAVGLMQIKPSTAADPNVGIKGVAENPDRNVEAGVKYLRFLADSYFQDLADDPVNQAFFALAAYNAGPSRFARLRKEAETKGYDPDEWFGNVEWIVRARVSREPVRYVGNIYKYYVAFAEDARHEKAEVVSPAE
ncbi:lytic transglycosylase F [Stappia sp.]|uniref:transglycosylase SLT domain-containing protein n=1 Tax=Stappia sp. TaxID=1870903 RepID=UPI0026003A62|nr:lytic transglycosylase F [Stappia sp.]